MDDSNSRFISDLRTKCEIKDALARYCRGVDRRDFDLVRSVYHSDAYDAHGPYNGNVDGLLDWMVKRHKSVAQSMHFLGNCIIDLKASYADVETYCVTYQKLHPESGGSTSEVGLTVGTSGQQTQVRCRYLDRFEPRQGLWKISRRVVVYESLLLEESTSNSPFASDMILATRGNDDPLYSVFGSS
ncbi:nuclear transport factor 2 family protein [Brevibacterium aurantiacum]|uniref:SnoaL-like domain-containing protein n=1 Tax=Brevibacterium aurantiacum TaxID=273384 RepID=A0A2A3Z1W2_BREAU|nr:hypothetical protein CIK64_15390 [Brevibacterium aurantiacum]